MSPDRQFMNELVDWLVGIERLAHDVYAGVATVLGKDSEVSRFVMELSEGEKQHAEMMGKVKSALQDMKQVPRTDIRLNAATREHVEGPLRQLQAESKGGTLTEGRAISAISEIEFSEWNDIFLYVINTVQPRVREAEVMAATIQEHERSIEAFNARLPAALRPHLDVSSLPKIWDTRLLLVEDNRALREALSAFLEQMGRVTCVSSGDEALEVMDRHFFDAVVSDLKMPGMGGIDLYKKAVARHQDEEGHFLFMSFNPTGSQQEYIRAHGLPFLLKPFGPDEFASAVRGLLLDQSVPNRGKES